MKKVKTVVTGVGSRIKELILTTNMSNNEILELVRKEHPLRKTTYACVAWYQSDLRKKAKAQDTLAQEAWEKAEREELSPETDELVEETEELSPKVDELVEE